MTVRIKAFLLLVIILLSTALSSCFAPDVNAPDGDSTPVRLRLSVGREGVSGISIPKSIVDKDGYAALPDGTSLAQGDLKPVWRVLSERLGISVVDEYSPEYQKGEGDLSEVDIIFGSVEELSALASEGKLIRLSAHLSSLPNLRERLLDTDVGFSFYTGDGEGEYGLYFAPTLYDAPYAESMPFMNAALIRGLLDGEGSYQLADSLVIDGVDVSPYMPTDTAVTVRIASPGGRYSESLRKNYPRSGNILGLLSSAAAHGRLDGELAVNLFRGYIDDLYDCHYGTRRSELFLGADAAWDADELFALLLCARACSQSGESFVGMTFDNYESALGAFATMFAVRGATDESGYSYFDPDGVLHDARLEPQVYELAERLNCWIELGLVKIGESEGGVVRYGDRPISADYTLTLPPIAHWYDGTNYTDGVELGSYLRFTDRISTVCPYGIAISREGVLDSPERLTAALKLIDYAYGEEGARLLCYGDDSYLKVENSTHLTAEYTGQRIYKLSEAVVSSAEAKGYSDLSEFLYDYLGAGVCFAAPTHQSLSSNYTASPYELMNTAHIPGVVGYPTYSWEGNEWYRRPPLTLPSSSTEREELIDLERLFGQIPSDEGTGHAPSYDGFGQLILSVAQKGTGGSGYASTEQLVLDVNNRWHGDRFLILRRRGYSRLIEYRSEYVAKIEY